MSAAAESATHHDVIILGSGQAGVPLAARLAGAGRRVLLVERSRLGGTCVNYGCTPTKTLVASARAAHVARTAGRLGVRCGEVAVDFAAVMARKDDIVRRWQEGVRRRVEGAGDQLRLARGHGRLSGEREVEVVEAGGAISRHRADVVILNTGARPAVPSLPGLDGVPFLDNASVMALPALPAHLLILGGGYIACEFAQIFRRLGARVTIVGRARHLLDREDEDVSAAIEEVFRGEGIELRLGVAPESVAKVGGAIRLRAGGEDLVGSHLLVATGRRPNTDDLGCDAGGVRLDPRGYVAVDDQYRTSAAGVYAVGDVTGGPQFTHTSWDDHRLLFEILMGRPGRGRGGRLVPSCVYTDPQVARVGLSEREARAAAVPCEVATMPFGAIARAIEIDETAGTMKLLLDPGTERVLGVALVGAEAGELIHVFLALMQAGTSGATARALVEMEAVHPSFAEGLQSLVMRLPRYALPAR